MATRNTKANARLTALSLLIATFSLSASLVDAASLPSVVPSAVPDIAAIEAEASRRFGLPVTWIDAVLQAESAGDPGSVSPKGAIGLMQLMPQTWQELRDNLGLGSNPFDVHDNILAGVAYLRALYDRYGVPGFLAAYNAGPARWEQHSLIGEPLPLETQAYVDRLVPIVRGVEMVGADTLSPMVDVAAASLFPKSAMNVATGKAVPTEPDGGLFTRSWHGKEGR